MGFEESYGYLIGTHARDKDGVVASMLIADMTSYWKSKGMNLHDALLALYKKHGYFIEDMISINLSGIEGIKKIEKIINDFRINHLKGITNMKVVEVKDYEKGIDGLPKSNVLKFVLEHDSWIAIRPSGTEPKLKVYIGICGESIESLETEIFNIKENIEKRIKLL